MLYSIPITPEPPLPPLPLYTAKATQAQTQGPLDRRVVNHHPMPLITLDHLRMRMPKTVLPPPRNQYPTRRRGADERFSGRTATAMMRRLQPVDPRLAIGRQPGPFGPGFNIPGQ